MQCALNFDLPGQRVYQLVQLHGDLPVVEKRSMSVKQAQVGNHSEGVGHGYDTVLNLDPVPCNTGRLISGWVTPESLSRAGGFFVAKCQYSRTQVCETAAVCRIGLPQYGRPCVDDPRRRYRHVVAQYCFNDGSRSSRWTHLIVTSGYAAANCQGCQVFADI